MTRAEKALMEGRIARLATLAEDDEIDVADVDNLTVVLAFARAALSASPEVKPTGESMLTPGQAHLPGCRALSSIPGNAKRCNCFLPGIAPASEVKPTGEGAGLEEALALRWEDKARVIEAVDPSDGDVHRFRECARELRLTVARSGWARLTLAPVVAPAPASEARCEECGCVCHIQPPGWLPSDVYHPHDCCDRPMQKGTGGAREGTDG